MSKLYLFFTLLILLATQSVFADSYTSANSGDFYDVTSWSPQPADVSEIRSGLHDFTIGNGHTIELNDSVNVNNLTVNGTLTFGTSASSHSLVVQGNFHVVGTANVAAFSATHKLYVYGGFDCDGTIDFRNNSNQVVNTYLNGTFTITGDDLPEFNSLNITGGTITAGRSLDINGNLLVDANFNAGNFTHTLAGNLTVNNSTDFTPNSGTIELDASLVQSITKNVTLYNLDVTGGGILSLSGTITVENDFTVSNSSRVVTSSDQNFQNAFTINSGSEFTANNEDVFFNGANQTITLTGDVEFYHFRADGSGTKTIAGSLVCNQDLYVSDGVTVADGAGQTHYLDGIRVYGTGTINFSHKIVFDRDSYALIRKEDGDPEITLGSAEIEISSNVYIGSDGFNTTLQTNNDVNILDDYLVIRDGSFLEDASTAATFSIGSDGTLYVRGGDNFPADFASYDLDDESWVRYDEDIDQVVEGNITYGYLYLNRKNKTVNGPLTIMNNLYVYTNDNDSVLLDLGTYDHHLKGHLYDNSDDNQTSYIRASGGTFYMDGIDRNQYIYSRGNNDTTFIFYNLTLQNPSPTDVKQFRFYGNDTDDPYDFVTDIIVLNNFTATNSTTNESLPLEIDFFNSIISNNEDGDNDGTPVGPGTFSLGENVKMFAAGYDNFARTTRNFATQVLHENSTVRFSSDITQLLPPITYGNVEFEGSGFRQGSFFGGGITVNGYIRRTGGTVVFKTTGDMWATVTHTINGDWELREDYVEYAGKEYVTIRFEGADQRIEYNTEFPNVVFGGSGTKTIDGNILIDGDIEIGNSIVLDASNRNIDITGSWNNASDGQFINTNGIVTFNGTTDQTIEVQTGNSSLFETITIEKDGGKIEALSDFDVARHFYFTESKGDFDLNDHTLCIGGNWYIQNNCDFTWDAGAILHFNGNSEDQLIRNYQAGTIYPDMKFSGSGMKRLYQEDFDINGDFIIDNASVRAEWFDIYIEGDWINSGGSYGHYRTTWFDGADQTIDATDFEDVVFSGTGTKYLGGHINLGGCLTIDSLATLDASPNGGTDSYNITVEEHWYNNVFKTDSTSTGQFIPRSGKVTFVGGNSNIYTGDSIDASGNGRAGKAFYNLVINNSSNDNYTRLYHDTPDDDNTVKRANDLKVENNFTITKGTFYSYWNHLHIGADLKNNDGVFNLNARYGQHPILYLEGVGAHQFDPGASHTVRRMEITKGGDYQLDNNLELSDHNDITELLITNGALDLNHNILTVNSNTGNVTIGSSGELEIDSLAQLQMYSGDTITNNGILRIVGTENGPAVITSISGNYEFLQEAGTIHANYYTIENTGVDGIVMNGGAIDATNNFSNGRFSGGGGNAYLTFPDGGMSIDGAMTISEVIFNNGPTYNISRENNSGTGVITFQNPSGSFAGEDFENDPNSYVDWDYSGSKFWDGDAGDGLWHTASNWEDNAVPGASDRVILNNKHVVGAYTVSAESDVEVKRVTVGESGSNTIDLIIDGGNFVIGDNITVNSAGTLTQTQATDTIKLGGSWSVDGTFSPNSSAVMFNPASGTHTISTGGNSFNDFIVSGIDGEMVLGSDIDIAGNLTVESGILSASNKDIYLYGNWFVGGGTFNGGDGTVFFDRNDATDQTISGGRFNDVTFRNSSDKVLDDLIYLEGSLTIEAGTFFNGGTHYIYVGDNWYNYEGVGGFSQTGTGTVLFNGRGTTEIGDYSAPANTESTTFNNLVFDGSGTKRIANSITVNGNLTNRDGSNVYVGSAGHASTEITGTAGGTFTMNGGYLYLLGTNSFPTSFGNYSLTGGTVDYYSDDPQNIYGGADVEYYNIRIRREHDYIDPAYNGGDNTIKTATGDLIVENQIWANDTCTILKMDGHDLYTDGSLRLATQEIGYPPQVQWDGGRFVHEGNNVTLDPDVIEYNEIVKRGDSWLYLSVDISVTGNVTISDDSHLNMQEYKMNCTEASKVFTLGANSRLYSYVADTVTGETNYAFPTGFASYSIEPSSLYYARGDQNQAIHPDVTYGTVYLHDNVTKTVTLHGDLDVEGDFYVQSDGITLEDDGYDLYLAGYNNDLRNYNPTSTIIFDGSSEQRVYAGGTFDELYLNNVTFNGNGGTTDIYEGDNYITGKIVIEENDTVFSNDNIHFTGDSLLNNGYFDHTNNAFNFQGEDQVISPGAGQFHDVLFNNKGHKTIIDTGINIDGDMTIYGAFVDADPDPYYDTVIVDFDTLTHYIASENIYIHENSTWDVDSANIYFDRSGTQDIPKIALNNVYFANRGYKFLTDTLRAHNITIENNVNFRSSEDSDNPNTIYCTGSWINNGAFAMYENVVYFDSPDTENQTIKTNDDDFYQLYINQSETSARTYTLQDNLQIDDELIVGNGAKLLTNGHNLQLGDNDTNDGFYPDGEAHTIEAGGTIEVDAGGGILFDQHDMYPKLTVYGTFKVVGESGNNATLGQLSGGYRRGTEITIESGAEVHFKYYNAGYLHYNGLVVKDGATIDATNNFSDGIWNDMYPYNNYDDLNDGTTRDQFIYLNIQNDVTGIGTIDNVTFNHPRTPTEGTHYNVYRPESATGNITFGGTTSGVMAGETYEKDEAQENSIDPEEPLNGHVFWPEISLLIWDGSESSDWATAENWTPAEVPDATKDVYIPLITDGGDNPLITNDAACKDLNISDGILGIEAAGVNTFDIEGAVVMESDAILAIDGALEIDVKGDWDIASDAIIEPGSSTVDFDRSSGSTVITPRNASFYNLKFSGGATFYISGNSVEIENNFILNNGDVIPNTDNYTYYVAGDYTKTGGSFSTNPDDGFFEFNGTAEQHISGGRFSRMRISNQSANVIIDDSTSVYFTNNNEENPAFEIMDGATFEAGAGAVLYVDGNVDIKEGGTFNDGGETHRFLGRHWVGNGNYTGTGTIRFEGNRQDLHRSHFNNLYLANTPESQNSWKYIEDTVNVDNNLTVNCYGLLLYDNHIINETGSGTFAVAETDPRDVRVYVRGEDNYPSGFGLYTCHEDAYIIYDAYFDQTVRGEVGGADVQYGRLYLRHSSTKTLEGDIDIDGQLRLDQEEVILDADIYNINIAGLWYNQNEGTFLPGTGEVVFDGDDDQRVYLGTSGSNDFYKIKVDMDNPAGRVLAYYNDINVLDKLSVRSGEFYCYNDYSVTIYGDMIAENDGTFANNGEYILANTNSAATVNVQFNGSEVRNFTLNGEATFRALDDLSVSNLFTLQDGVFDGNGQTITLGDNNDVANVYSLYKIGENGTLKLGNRTTFNIYSGGEVQVIGSEGNPATVTKRDGNDYYYFNIENGGTISASNYVFEYMYDAGVYVKDGATIDETHNFSNGTFTNPYSGGICLRIENTQSFVDNDSIVNVRFPNNPGNGTKNVAKLVSTSGVLDFYSASGDLAGSDYEDDNYNLINWPGVNTVTWVGGSGGAGSRRDWNIAANWEPARVPENNDNVVIPDNTTVTYPPVFNIDEIAGATDTVKSIENNNTLFIYADNTELAASLVIQEEMENNDKVNYGSDSAILDIQGTFTNNGTFSPTTGGVLKFSGNNLSSVNTEISQSWLSLQIDKNGTVQFSQDGSFKDIYIKNGELQYTNNNRELISDSDFINEGEVDMSQSRLKLNGSGSHSFVPNGSQFYDVEIASGTYTLNSTQLDVTHLLDIKSGAELHLNGNSILYGTGTTSGSFIVDGLLSMDDDSRLQLRSDADVDVGGTFKAVGSKDHEAVITRSGTGRYQFVVTGNIGAGNYIFEYLDADGLTIESGATVDSLSNGKFSYGANGGRYLNFEHSFGPADDSDTLLIQNIQFDEGPDYNAKRLTSTDGIIEFKDAFGLTAGHYYEDDDGEIFTGAIVWSYTKPTLIWEGSVSDRWDEQQNWNPEAVPDDESIIIIENGAPNYPVIDADMAAATVYAKKLTVNGFASITLDDDKDMEVVEDVTILGTFTVSSGSNSNIKVGASWSNGGTFTHGGNSTIEFTSEANMDINTGGQSFYNLTLNSGEGTGSAIFSTQSALEVEGDLNITTGTLQVENSSHTIQVGGDFINNGAFVHGDGDVILNGNSAQNISIGTDDFYNILLSGTGSKTLTDNMNIENELDNESELNADSYTINIQGDWLGAGTFNPQTGTVVFNGTSSQEIERQITFNNLTINNTNLTTAINLGDPVTVTGTLNMTDGIIESNTSNLLILESSAALAGSSDQSYINGAMRKVGDADFVFPIGSGSVYARLGISDLSGSSAFTATYYSSDFNSTSLGADLNHVSDVEHWTLTRNSGTAEPYVTYYWEDGNYSGIDDLDPLVSAYYESGTGWVNHGQSANTGTADAGTITASDRFTSDGYFTIGWEYIELIWDGDIGTSWSEAANWNHGTQVPSATTNLIIPGSLTNYPSISSDTESYDLEIENGGEVTVQTGQILDVKGNFNMVSGGTMNIEGTGEVYFKGDVTNAGTLSAASGSTISINGDIAQTVDNLNADNLVIDGTDTKTLTGAIVVDGQMSISGDVDASTASIELAGDLNLTGTLSNGTSSILLNGTEQQVISGNKQVNMYDLTVNNTFATAPQIDIQTNVLVNNSLTLTDGIVQTNSSSILTVGISGTSTEGSANSFVDGPMRKNGVSDFVFPLGDGDRWARLAISDMSGGASGNFDAQYFYEGYGTYTPVSGNVDHVSIEEYWDLSRASGTGTGEPLVTLYWEDTASSAIDDPAQLVVAHYDTDNNQWQDMGNSDYSWNESGNYPGYVKSSVNFVDFSPVTFGSTGPEINPLPVELKDFNVQANDQNEVLATWKTLSESQNSHFILERSKEGVVFEEAGTIKGAGNSAVTLAYNYVDNEPFEGVSYYRLVQVDLDGERSISEIKSVFIETEELYFDIALYPNPVNSGNCFIELEGSNKASMMLTLVSSTGQVVAHEKMEVVGSRNDISHLVNDLSSGIYTVIVIQNNRRVMRKLFIE